MEDYKYPKAAKLGEWLKKASPELRAELSHLAATSEAMYRQWITGRRAMSADKAGAIESVMRYFARNRENAPAPLTRGDLCETCRRCNYFQASQSHLRLTLEQIMK